MGKGESADIYDFFIFHKYSQNLFLSGQNCGIPLPALSDLGLIVGRQVDFARGLVCGQVNV